jgi:hypothetical protein
MRRQRAAEDPIIAMVEPSHGDARPGFKTLKARRRARNEKAAPA